MFKRILMAYNGSREGKSALLACRELAGFTKADTHLLAVATLSSSVFLAEGFHPDELLEQERAHAQEVLEEGIGQLTERGFTVAGHLAVGGPVEEICRLAAELKADLCRGAEGGPDRRRARKERVVPRPLVARLDRQISHRPRALQRAGRSDRGRTGILVGDLRAGPAATSN
ncbi:MAG: universal stress protein [Betaproteobacteria bacterium]|nr:universal stress protein [Betaproteobacteria bacterium]